MTSTLSSAAVQGHVPLVESSLLRRSGISLVDQIVQSIQARIDTRLLKAGERMPSIRQLANDRQVSCFTVVEAYDRLVAAGYLESRRGSGFFVRQKTMPPEAHAHIQDKPGHVSTGKPDLSWALRHLFPSNPSQAMPGASTLPSDWLDSGLIANGLRAVSRQNRAWLLQGGTYFGFLPLRCQLQIKMAALDIGAEPGQIVTTAGITQALNLIARTFLSSGDTVFVDDPSWFMLPELFSAVGAKVVGIPRDLDGPDMAQLEQLMMNHRPSLYVLNSVLHNPSSGSLSASKAFQLLKLAQSHGCTLVEDDAYGDLHPGSGARPLLRLAALDQLNQVIYLGGFAKTLSPNLRVGFIAASQDHAARLAERKALAGLATSEFNERVVHKILSEGGYRKHLDRLRSQLDTARERSIRDMESVGLNLDQGQAAGMYVWMNVGCDTGILAEQGVRAGFLFAPGTLFSPARLPSTRLRMNVTTMSDPGVLSFLQEAIQAAWRG